MTDWEAERRFEQVYDAYHRQVYAYFRRRTDLSAAQDCTADTFLLTWRRLDRVPEGESALPWLYAAARRVLANHNRASRRFNRLLGRLAGQAVADPARPESVVLRRESAQEVFDALDHLRPDDRDLLRLAFWEELPREQLAGVFHCTPHALSQRIQRAEARLARHLPAAGHTPGEAARTRHGEGSRTDSVAGGETDALPTQRGTGPGSNPDAAAGSSGVPAGRRRVAEPVEGGSPAGTARGSPAGSRAGAHLPGDSGLGTGPGTRPADGEEITPGQDTAPGHDMTPGDDTAQGGSA